ncbi:hypothetical protein Salat_2999700 [Sesamum alatum]|uniref:Uncharacterized protein n=1 Tax=Sesamum alatum TaxID=300844 RepID=A0AAE1XHK4_9LAMI|nr:hypothetical protein Salat_2999700 [Sesamum alatum]
MAIGGPLSPFHIRPGRIAGPHPLPSDNFKHSLTLFSKSFFIFPSQLGYLFAIGLSPVFSLGRNLPPIGAAFPKQPDSPTAPRGATGSGHDGALTLSGAPFQGLGPGPPLRTLLQTTIRTAKPPDSQVGLFPVRSPLLEGILLRQAPLGPTLMPDADDAGTTSSRVECSTTTVVTGIAAGDRIWAGNRAPRRTGEANIRAPRARGGGRRDA